MNDSTFDCQETAGLLELVRQNTELFDPETEDEARRGMELVREHQSEFPSVIRTAIREASAVENPGRFLGDLHHQVAKLFIGFLADQNGLDSDVDTEQEAELAIRFFLQSERVQAVFLIKNGRVTMKPNFPLFGISLILNFKKAVAFVPVFLRVAVETYGAEPHDEFFLDVLNQLLVNRRGPYEEDFHEGPSDELDERSLEALVRLKELGWVETEATYGLVSRLFDGQHDLKSEFIERRLRLLIDWNPSILKQCKGCSSLLCYFHLRCRHSMAKEVALRTFRVICELGMLHYPQELGFVFHESTYKDFCNFYWTQPIAEIFHDKLFRSLQRNGNISLDTLAFAAATNEKIPLDGLYTLFRCDPNGFVQKLSNPKNRKRNVPSASSSPQPKKTKSLNNLSPEENPP